EVEFARPHHRVAADAVPMFDLAGEEPAHRLQTSVGMRWYDHPAPLVDIIRTVVVDETPGADEGSRPLGERSAHGHGAWPAEGHLPVVEEFHPRGGADVLAE